MDRYDHIKSLVRKLLSLSKSDNENEAEAALRKANELMEQYGIGEEEAAIGKVGIKAVSRHVPWRAMIANAVSWLYCCYWYSTADGYFVFNGEELDAFMSGEMYGYLSKTIERAAKKEIRKNAKYRFRRDFKRGMASRLYDRIMELGEACSWKNSREAKIEYVRELVKKHVETRPGAAKDIKPLRNAFVKGTLRGDGVSLARQAGYEAPALIARGTGLAQGELF